MNRPFPEQLAWTIALFVSGVAAGMFLMDCFGYYPVLARLPNPDAIELHQQSLPVRRVLFRAAIGGSGLASVVLLLFFTDTVSRRWLILHLICLIALILYTNWALVPLNREIATWVPASPPSGWRTQFSSMISRERLRSVVPAVAFVAELIAYAVRRN